MGGSRVSAKTQSNTQREPRGVRSIELGARLLRILSEHGEPMMLKELSVVSGQSSAQVHAYMASFQSLDFVSRDSNGLYQLGPACIEFGAMRMRITDPMKIARHAAQSLSEETSSSVALVVWGSFGPTVTEIFEGVNQLNMNTRPGTVYSLSGTASGRIFAAFLPEETYKQAVNRELIEKKTSARVGNVRKIRKSDIEQIRRDAFATIDRSPVPGITAISAPVFDSSAQLVAAVTLIAHEATLEKEFDTFASLLKRATQSASRDLGYSF